MERFLYGDNAQILRLIFEGELHRTATVKPYRGKGLPGIYRAFQEGNFSDFVMVTNDAMYDSRSNTFLTLKTPFSGTFVYWTIARQNRSFQDAN